MSNKETECLKQQGLNAKIKIPAEDVEKERKAGEDYFRNIQQQITVIGFTEEDVIKQVYPIGIGAKAKTMEDFERMCSDALAESAKILHEDAYDDLNKLISALPLINRIGVRVRFMLYRIKEFLWERVS